MTRFPVEVLTNVEIRAMLRKSGRGATALRNRAIIVTMWRAGLRCSEVLALAPRDVDLETGTVRVRHGKGSRARTVALDPVACDVVRRWVEYRKTLDTPAGARLFCTLKGRPVQPAYLRQLLPRLAARAGIAKRVHPHALRHTFAVELDREGKPLHLIQAALGHNNAATTSQYLSHLEPQELVAAIRGRRWASESPPDTAPTSSNHPSDTAPAERMRPSYILLSSTPKTELPPDGPAES